MANTKKTVIPTPTKRRQYGLADWLRMTTEEVLDKFASLKDAQRVGKDKEQFIYIPGTREDRVLLVAHSDTVWDDEKREIGFDNGSYYSIVDKVGIGADDRAGCCMLWQLKDLGHSLLIPNGEECGCRGSHFLMNDEKWKKEINDNHQFMLEIDRMNDNDLAFYSIASDEFKDWCEKNLKKYKRTHGIYTDICVLCDSISGVNISCGYYNQHTGDEYLVESEWERTFRAVKDLLSQQKLPKFKLEKPKYEYKNNRVCDNSYNYGSTVRRKELPISSEIDSCIMARIDDILVCSHCTGIMDASEYKNNGGCIFCNRTF